MLRLTTIIAVSAAAVLSSCPVSEAFAPQHSSRHAQLEPGLNVVASPPPSIESSSAARLSASLTNRLKLESVFKKSADSQQIMALDNDYNNNNKPISKRKRSLVAETTLQHHHHKRTKMHRPSEQYSRVEPAHAGHQISEQKASAGLTRDEEIQYSFQIRNYRAAQRLREQMVKVQDDMHIHPSENEWAAACGTSVLDLRRVLHDGQEARAHLVAANIGLVTSVAKKHYHAIKRNVSRSSIITLQDLIQEGNLGLMEAAERFEPEKGFRFSTYATWWIRQRISHCITQQSRIIRLPAHVHSTLQKINKAKIQLKHENGKEPSLQELSQYLEIPLEKLVKYTKSNRNVLSLESPLRSASYKEDSRTIMDTLASDAPTPEENIQAEYLRRDIQEVMNVALQDNERDVIVSRFGLDDSKPRSVAETARRLGITIDRVRTVEARALNKLRHPQRNHRLKEYVGGENHHSQPEPASNNGLSSLNTPIPHPQRKDSADASSRPDRIWLF